MGFEVETLKFEGPLDLMLHLIHEQQLDIFDLDMEVLTDQYIRYLHAMEDLHLEVESEYLVELATLVEYKSRKLLPKREEELEDDYEDPKDRLVRRLLEYQQFKEISASFGRMYEERQEMLSKPVSGIIDEWANTEPDDSHYEGNPYDLMRAMRKVLMRIQLQKPIETKYTHREISMEDRELEVRAKLDRLPETFRFENLLDDCTDMPMFIATFLAVLDLARLHTLVFTVDENDVIWFSRGTGMA